MISLEPNTKTRGLRAQLRAERRALGLCVDCGKKAVNKTRCERHRKQYTESARRRMRIRAGHPLTAPIGSIKRKITYGKTGLQCVACSNPRVGRFLCATCSEQREMVRRKIRRARDLARRKEDNGVAYSRAQFRRLSNGQCMRCGDALFTKLFCKRCKEINNVGQRFQYLKRRKKAAKPSPLDRHFSKIFSLTTGPEKKSR